MLVNVNPRALLIGACVGLLLIFLMKEFSSPPHPNIRTTHVVNSQESQGLRLSAGPISHVNVDDLVQNQFPPSKFQVNIDGKPVTGENIVKYSFFYDRKMNIMFNWLWAVEDCSAHKYDEPDMHKSIFDYSSWYSRVGPNDIVLDIGAQTGNTMIMMAQRVKKVIAIEASPRSYRIAQLNALINPHLDIEVFNFAASDHNGELTFTFAGNEYACNGGETMSSDDPNHGLQMTVPARDINQFLAQLPEKPTFIKIDIESKDGWLLSKINRAYLNNVGVVIECYRTFCEDKSKFMQFINYIHQSSCSIIWEMTYHTSTEINDDTWKFLCDHNGDFHLRC